MFSESVNSRITEELAPRCILGVTVCVRVDDAPSGILYINTHKKPRAGAEASLNEGDLFLIASQSKTFTAVAALSLIERGLLNLESKLIDLLPDLEKSPDHSKLADVTIENLLQHRAPLNWLKARYRDWDTGVPYPSFADISGPNLFPMLDADRLSEGIGEPSYSNASYALLGAIVERVARKNNLGSSFGDFIQKNLLGPNELDEIYPGLSDQEIGNAKNMVQGYYMMKDETLRPSLKPSLGACAPSGGFYGTAEQVSKFYHLLLSGKILAEHSLEAMKKFSKIFWPSMEKTFWEGMGLSRYKIGGEDWWGHGGVMTGYNSCTVHKDGVTISMMSNLCTPSKEYGRFDYGALKEKPLFEKIAAIVIEEIAKHYPGQKWAIENPELTSRITEGRGPAP